MERNGVFHEPPFLINKMAEEKGGLVQPFEKYSVPVPHRELSHL